MSWDNCILLVNSDSVGFVYTGDIVTGSVILEFKKEQKVEYLSLKIIGKTKAQWNRPQPTIPYIKFYSERRNFLNMEIDLLKELRGNKIKSGTQNMDFHFALPSNLPSTFKNSIARISYIIKIEGKSSMKFKKEKKTELFVKASVNLNCDELYLSPVCCTFSKTLWNSKNVSFTFKTFRGAAPNQFVPFEIFITNENKVKISKLLVTLVQKLQYNVASGYADREKEKRRVQYKNISNTVVETCCFGMEIPETNPSTLSVHGQDTVDISYVFRLHLHFAFHIKLIEEIPVTIASVPVIHSDFGGKASKEVGI